MLRSYSVIGFLVVTLLTLAVIALGQGNAAKSSQKLPKTPTVPIHETPAYLYREIQKLKKEVATLQTRLAAAESKNKAQDDSLKKKEDKVVVTNPDYAGGGWCTKNVFLTAMDKDKTMIRYVTLK